MCADTTKCAHFLIRKWTFDWKHALERLRSHEHSMEHVDATIIFSGRCNNHYEALIQNSLVRSTNANNIGNRLWLQRLISVVKFVAERGLPFRDDTNVRSPRKFFQKIFKTSFKQILKKRRCDASSAVVLQLYHTPNPCVVFQAFVEPYLCPMWQKVKMGYMFHMTFVEPLKWLRRTRGSIEPSLRTTVLATGFATVSQIANYC